MEGQCSDRAPLTLGDAARPVASSCSALPRSSCTAHCPSVSALSKVCVLFDLR